MVWFAFNFLLIMLPVVSLGYLGAISENLDIKSSNGSYLALMIIVLVVNLVQFILRPRMFSFVKKTASLSSLNSMNAQDVPDSDQGQDTNREQKLEHVEKSLIRGEEYHYVWMELSFSDDHMWYWWINLVTYIAVLISYLLIDGHEMVFALYLPLDMLMNACKAGFFFIHYFRDRREKGIEAQYQENL